MEDSVNLIDDNSKCSCKGDSLEKFLQPLVLSILVNKHMHGYMIISELEKNNNLKMNAPDKTGVYRALRLWRKRA